MRDDVPVIIGPQLPIYGDEVFAELSRRRNARIGQPERIEKFSNRLGRVPVKIPERMVEIKKKVFVLHKDS